MSGHIWHKTAPPENEVIIVSTGTKKEQVTVRGETAFLWRYKNTDIKFCDVSEVVEWRGCGGFDY